MRQRAERLRRVHVDDTTITGFIGQREIGPITRMVCVSAIMLVATLLALAGRGDFLAAFSTFILFLLTFFTPW